MSRFLNLVYYWVVSQFRDEYDAKGKVRDSAVDKRKRFDRELAQVRNHERPINVDKSTPSWWKGDKEASDSALAVARAFGFNPAAMIAAAQASG